MGAAAFSVNDGSDGSHRVDGYHNSWKVIGGAPWSRARCAITAAMVPRGISGHGQPGHVRADVAAVTGHPLGRGPGVVNGRGIGMFGRQPVVDGYHHRLRAHGVLAGSAVMGIQVADDETPPWKYTTTGRSSESIGGQ